MDEFNIIELSKIYKRVLLIEITLRDRIFNALVVSYPQPFNKLNQYFKNIISFSKYNYKEKGIEKNRISEIILSNNSQFEKLIRFLNISYLSDTLKLLTDYKLLYKDKLFCKNLYQNKPIQNDLKKYARRLNALRNAIMHSDYITYSFNKLQFVETLNFWEVLLYCPNAELHNLPRIKPHTKKILKQLITIYPNLFEMNDRLVLDMFDDLAFMNGCPVEDLPKLWTVGRQLFELKNEYKNKLNQLDLPY